MYSLDFREKVLELRQAEGLSMTVIASRFGISFMSVMRWSQRIQPTLKRNKPATRLDMKALKRDIKAYSDAFYYERAHRLGVSTTCIFHALKRLGVTYKKKPSTSQGMRRREASLPKGV